MPARGLQGLGHPGASEADWRGAQVRHQDIHTASASGAGVLSFNDGGDSCRGLRRGQPIEPVERPARAHLRGVRGDGREVRLRGGHRQVRGRGRSGASRSARLPDQHISLPRHELPYGQLRRIVREPDALRNRDTDRDQTGMRERLPRLGANQRGGEPPRRDRSGRGGQDSRRTGEGRRGRYQCELSLPRLPGAGVLRTGVEEEHGGRGKKGRLHPGYIGEQHQGPVGGGGAA